MEEALELVQEIAQREGQNPSDSSLATEVQALISELNNAIEKLSVEPKPSGLPTAFSDPEIVFVNIWNNVGGELKLQGQTAVPKEEFDEMTKNQDFSKLATMMDSSPESGENVAAYSSNKVAPGLGGVGPTELPRSQLNQQLSDILPGINQGNDGLRLNTPISLQAYAASKHKDSPDQHQHQPGYSHQHQGLHGFAQYLPQTTTQPPVQQIDVDQKSSSQGLSVPNEIAKWILTQTSPKPVVLHQKPSPFKSPVGIRVPSFLELYGNFDPELHNQQNAEESADTQILAPSFPGQNQILAPNFAAQTAPPPSQQQQQQQPVKQKPHFHYPSKMHEQYNKDMEAIRQYLDRVTGRETTTQLPLQTSTPPFLVVNNRNKGSQYQNPRPSADLQRLMEENRVLNHILQTLFSEEETAKMKAQLNTPTQPPYKVIQLKETEPINKFFKQEKEEEIPVVKLLKQFDNLDQLKETLRDDPTFFTRIDGLHNLKKTSVWKRSLEGFLHGLESRNNSSNSTNVQTRTSGVQTREKRAAEPFVLEVPDIFKDEYSGDKSPNKNDASSSSGGGGQFIPEVIRLELNKIGLEEETNEYTNENTKISFYEVPSEQTEGTWGEVSGLESTTTTSTTTTEPEPFYQIPAGNNVVSYFEENSSETSNPTSSTSSQQTALPLSPPDSLSSSNTQQVLDISSSDLAALLASQTSSATSTSTTQNRPLFNLSRDSSLILAFGLSLIPTIALAYPFLSPRLRQAGLQQTGRLAATSRQLQDTQFDPTDIRLPANLSN